MDFTLNEDHRAIKELAASFAREHIAPFAARWDREHFLSHETLKEGAKLGFSSLYVSQDVGGVGLTRLDAVLVFEELSQACPAFAAFFSIHNMVSWIIDRYGTPEQRHTFLPHLTTMEKLGSYCLTEPGSGSDAAALKTRAVLEGGDYVLNGSKAFISGGGVSDVYVVMARTGGEGPSGISCFIVEKGTKGLSFGASEHKMGWNCQPTTMVLFDDCRIPRQNLVGVEGQGFSIAMSGLDGGRLNIAACSLGGGQACLDLALRYLKERKQFGKFLGAFQALQFRVADMATELEAARLLLYCAAQEVEKRTPLATRYAAMAKRKVTDVGFEVANQALQLHGGYGYLCDFPLEKYVRDLRVHQILEGTNEIMRLIVARDLFRAE